jgi:hypothetical protein
MDLKKSSAIIENKRGSKNIFWTTTVVLKDFLWFLKYYMLDFPRQAEIFFLRKRLF